MPRIPSKNKGGDCYRAAANYVIDHALFGKEKGLVLVHGTATGQGPIEGIKFGHAWVEDGSVVIDVSNGENITMPRMFYYAIGQIEHTVKYTPEQTRDRLIKHGHFGPWK